MEFLCTVPHPVGTQSCTLPPSSPTVCARVFAGSYSRCPPPPSRPATTIATGLYSHYEMPSWPHTLQAAVAFAPGTLLPSVHSRSGPPQTAGPHSHFRMDDLCNSSQPARAVSASRTAEIALAIGVSACRLLQHARRLHARRSPFGVLFADFGVLYAKRRPSGVSAFRMSPFGVRHAGTLAFGVLFAYFGVLYAKSRFPACLMSVLACSTRERELFVFWLKITRLGLGWKGLSGLISTHLSLWGYIQVRREVYKGEGLVLCWEEGFPD